ncbi:MAG: CRISPR-associated endonuclease Cas2 [Candidatus Baldrarchaeia archaeon]
MLYLVVYDVRDDRVRNEVRELLRDWGGEWIQRSAFLIDLSEARLQILKREIADAIAKTEADVLFIPLCKADLERMVHISTKEKVLEKKKVEEGLIF